MSEDLQPVKQRKLTGKRLTQAEIVEIEPVIRQVISENPDATLKRLHQKVCSRIATQCSQSFVYKVMKRGF
jgi:hypothetical protein